MLIAIGLGVTMTTGVTATYDPIKTTAYVVIDGVDYGTFDHINDVRDLTSHGLPHKKGQQEAFTRVVLKRDFVTAPSLYFWAQNSSQKRGGLTDVNLVMRTSDGLEVSRYTLKYCKPLS